MYKIFVSLIIMFTFQGCLIEHQNYYKFKYLQSTEITDFRIPIEKLLIKMNERLLNIRPYIIDKHIYVVDFMNIKNLDLTSQLGFSLSSEVKSSVTYLFGYKIKELEYMKYFKIDESGTKLLSRNINDVSNTFEKTYALIGTYVVTQRQLILYLKLIDMTSGNILATTSESIEITDEILEMEKNYRKEKINLKPHVVL